MTQFDESRWRYSSADRIEVVQHGPFYRASTMMSIRPGSPHRAMFMSGKALINAWGCSAESAARRCADKRRKVFEDDERLWASKRARTKYFNGSEVR